MKLTHQAEWRENREEDTDDNDDESYQDTVTEDEFEDEMLMETPVPKKRGRPRKNSTTVKTVTPKTARAHAKSYRPGPPIVPRLIVNKLLDYIAKVNFRKKQQFVERLCRYWSLKREARRGAPLLKRLHLEPWTATSESREQTEAQKAKKLEVSWDCVFFI
jgi:NuA3 HAT complex component NTO1